MRRAGFVSNGAAYSQQTTAKDHLNRPGFGYTLWLLNVSDQGVIELTG
jgi:hypothetical protein